MASTNKTTNYNLSQFLGTDKPAWLSDYNQDMSKIDTQMKANADAATAAAGSASSANTAIGDITNLTTTAKTDVVAAINEVDSNADTAQNTATNAFTASQTNASAISSLTSYLDLNTFTTPTVTCTNFTDSTSSDYVSCASNNTGSLGKIYGQIRGVAQSSSFTISFPTPLRPDTAITINGLVTSFYSNDGSTNWIPITNSITIATDGTASIAVSGSVSGRYYRFQLGAVLIFAKSFGDVPIPE